MAAERPDSEEEIFDPTVPGRPRNGQPVTGCGADEEAAGLAPFAGEKAARPKLQDVRWHFVRPAVMAVVMPLTLFLSSLFTGWLEHGEPFEPSLESMLRYGSIPLVAAVIGYGTNIVALEMMFYPLEFIGFFPEAKIGCGLDLPLFGWQGVIPMRAREMAEISVTLVTQKLIRVQEIFVKLDPATVAKELTPGMPNVIREVVERAGRAHIPKLWEATPPAMRAQLQERVLADSEAMMVDFFRDLQVHIDEVFDLKHCVVEKLVQQKQILNEIFLACGAEEFEFIRISGFYLGFLFGLAQMFFWMFVKKWWILPLCGVFVGWFTNVVALKVIFLPVEARLVLGGRLEVQGLFLQRQKEVSALYAKEIAGKLLTAEVLMDALVHGNYKDKMLELVDKHVAANIEAQASYFKPMFLMSMGAETWIGFRAGACAEFKLRLHKLLRQVEAYADEAMELEDTLRGRLERLTSSEFERLLHAVFEQDEIKLILVGAILGFLVGFIQAMVQTPEQLGLA